MREQLLTKGNSNMEGARAVRAPRGTTLTPSWATEAPMRMLMNNLDPDIAERPDDLVVYGGTGRAARDWRAFDAMVRTLTTWRRRDHAGPVRPAGRSDADPRVGTTGDLGQLQPGPGLGDWPEFRRLEKLGLTMYGQMTAGSWIYIGTQGIVQGTYETFAAVAEKRFDGTLAGTLTLTGGCGGHGRRPAAGGHPERGCLPDRRRGPGSTAAPGRSPLSRRDR